MPPIHVLSYSFESVLQMLTLQVLFLTVADLLIETDKMEFCMHCMYVCLNNILPKKQGAGSGEKYRFLIKLIYFTP